MPSAELQNASPSNRREFLRLWPSAFGHTQTAYAMIGMAVPAQAAAP